LEIQFLVTQVSWNRSLYG